MDTQDIQRRNRTDKWTPAEHAIAAAVHAVEAMGADLRLTDAVTLLYQARMAVADYVDGVKRRRSVTASGAARMPETDRQMIVDDRPCSWTDQKWHCDQTLAPLLRLSDGFFDGLRRYRHERVNGWAALLGELDAQRAARATAILERDSARDQFDRHVEWASAEIKRVRATAYAEGYWDVIDQIKAHCIDGAELDECVMSIVGSRRNRDD